MNNDKVKEDALEQSIALTEVVKDLLKSTKQHLNRVYIVLIISILSNLIIVGAFLWYESQFTYEKETTVTQTVDGENSTISNAQYNDNAVHNE
nr:MAG TPA: hypothetical protein [Caudoviricetes sp.]